jgi:hypothetical protein
MFSGLLLVERDADDDAAVVGVYHIPPRLPLPGVESLGFLLPLDPFEDDERKRCRVLLLI